MLLRSTVQGFRKPCSLLQHCEAFSLPVLHSQEKAFAFLFFVFLVFPLFPAPPASLSLSSSNFSVVFNFFLSLCFFSFLLECNTQCQFLLSQHESVTARTQHLTPRPQSFEAAVCQTVSRSSIRRIQGPRGRARVRPPYLIADRTSARPPYIYVTRNRL